METRFEEGFKIMGEQEIRLRGQYLRIPRQPDRVRAIERENRLGHLRIGRQPRSHIEPLPHPGGHGPERPDRFRLAGHPVAIDIDPYPGNVDFDGEISLARRAQQRQSRVHIGRKGFEITAQ